MSDSIMPSVLVVEKPLVIRYDMMYLASCSGATGVPSAVMRVMASLEMMMVWLRGACRGAQEQVAQAPTQATHKHGYQRDTASEGQ